MFDVDQRRRSTAAPIWSKTSFHHRSSRDCDRRLGRGCDRPRPVLHFADSV